MKRTWKEPKEKRTSGFRARMRTQMVRMLLRLVQEHACESYTSKADLKFLNAGQKGKQNSNFNAP